MTRDLGRLRGERFDVLIIGGGIHGACAAWDAALRGLSVALIDQGDFGAQTSANSLKIIHGGLRYLQTLSFRRMRLSIEERSALLRIAPHLVRPLPCLIPIYGHGLRGTEAFRAAMFLADLVGSDRNRGLRPEARLPAGRTIPASECRQLFDGFDTAGLTAGALWYDAQAIDSERLTLSFLLSAAERGASLANYVRADSLRRHPDGQWEVAAIDLAGRTTVGIRASTVLNTAGPWADVLLSHVTPAVTSTRQRRALAMNLVVPARLGKVAVGVRARGGRERDALGGDRYLFLTPWRQSTLIGTSYAIAPDSGPAQPPSASDIQAFIDTVNEACPKLAVRPDDVTFTHWGVLPLAPGSGSENAVLADAPRITDHGTTDNASGLVTAVGVKYTTARRVASDAIDLIASKLGRSNLVCRTSEVPIYGGEDATSSSDQGDAYTRLRTVHGNRAESVATGLRDDAGWQMPLAPGCDVLTGEVLHAVRHEMAITLADVVMRRTGMGAEREPPRAHLEATAQIMGGLLGWSETQRAAELDSVLSVYVNVPRRAPVEGHLR